ncbi:MAG: PTS sugar transporter [Roseburia sp.]
MKQVQVLINAPEKAERFCRILSSHRGPFDLAKGSYTVDGKSILGICSMDLSAPLTLTIYNDCENVEEELKEFVV